MSPAEYNLFTQIDPDNWVKLYGFNDKVEAFNTLSSAKNLARRLDISYKELTTLVKSRFINPSLNNLVTLRKLSIEPQDIFSFMSEDPNQSLSEVEKESILNKLKENVKS